MVEPWAYTISLDAIDPDSTDPDRPIAGRLVKNAKKPARTGLAIVLYVCSKVCLREMIRQYLEDNSGDGKSNIFYCCSYSELPSAALNISTDWCCDLDHPDHPERKFDKHTFFPGRFLYGDDNGAIFSGAPDEEDRVHLNPPKSRKRKSTKTSNRKVAHRGDLQRHLHEWLPSAHAADPLRAVRPSSFILDAETIKASSSPVFIRGL
ncbi:hypothetical protein C8R46DRAFT_1210042 [Mycena filopes]|nr:hypothetical protein C8R46DRAFT_1210042 [Mycena filopes]